MRDVGGALLGAVRLTEAFKLGRHKRHKHVAVRQSSTDHKRTLDAHGHHAHAKTHA